MAKMDHTVQTIPELKMYLGDDVYEQLLSETIQSVYKNKGYEDEWSIEDEECLNEEVYDTLYKIDISKFKELDAKEGFALFFQLCTDNSKQFTEEKNEWLKKVFVTFKNAIKDYVYKNKQQSLAVEFDESTFIEEINKHEVVFDGQLFQKMKNVQLRVNIPIEMPHEKDSSYKNTMDLICDLKENHELYEEFRNSYEQTGLLWLIEQQGYTLEDVYENGSRPEEEQNSFLTSVLEEINEVPLDASQMKLYVMSRMDLKTYIALLSKEETTVQIDSTLLNGCMGGCGLFNPLSPYQETNFGILLHKDLVLPNSMIGDIQIEDLYRDDMNEKGIYTIYDCYRFIDSCWIDATTLTKDTENHTVCIHIDKINDILEEEQKKIYEDIEWDVYD